MLAEAVYHPGDQQEADPGVINDIKAREKELHKNLPAFLSNAGSGFCLRNLKHSTKLGRRLFLNHQKKAPGSTVALSGLCPNCDCSLLLVDLESFEYVFSRIPFWKSLG